VADWTIAYDTAPLDVDGDGDPDTVALGLPASMNASTGSGPLAGTWTTATTGYTPRYQATGTTRVLPEGPDLAGLPRTWTVGHRWRGNGDPDRTVLPPVVDPVTGEVLLPGEEVVTGYDGYGRPATVTGAGAYVAGTVYTPAGRPAVTGSEPVPGAGTWTTTGYDGAGRPARAAWYTTGPDGTIAQDQLATTSHDPAGNPTRTTTIDTSTPDTSTLDTSTLDTSTLPAAAAAANGAGAAGAGTPAAGTPAATAADGTLFDGLNDAAVSEVKNVRYLSFTRQVRDYADYASQNGLRLDIYVRGDTNISGPLARADLDPMSPVNMIRYLE
jgi:hypothetical protein